MPLTSDPLTEDDDTPSDVENTDEYRRLRDAGVSADTAAVLASHTTGEAA